MNTLSAIRAFSPDLASPVQKPGGQPSVPSSIPLSELRELGSATNGQMVPAAGQTATPFSTMFGQMVNEVNDKQLAAADAVQGLLSGQKVPLHQAVIAMEEANVSFQLMVEVRNKVLEAYQELMRMQI
jgi:flagellar hook-basal body complex protein FliE